MDILTGASGDEKLQFSASAYVSGYAPPSLDENVSGSCVYVPKTSFRHSKRGFAREQFYGHLCRHDSIMVQSDKTEVQFTKSAFYNVACKLSDICSIFERKTWL